MYFVELLDMSPIVLHSRVGSDGVLQLSVPVGTEQADREVRVLVTAEDRVERTQAEWEAWVDELAGS